MKYAKAIYAGIMGFVTTVVQAMVDGGIHDVTDQQWGFALIAGLTLGGGVAGLTNKNGGK